MGAPRNEGNNVGSELTPPAADSPMANLTRGAGNTRTWGLNVEVLLGLSW